ncbi:TlpA family protein disulfide reductase [Opitutus terrae]|uniref:Redoxin domain protein n=1 Tax=Opitutus terrae (strain DSM 11246 / JCM 15787 / PB90-1) TaxID=452637 RepID=B1ZRU3_OPITP|nr:TlpA disulfide reductase family protein [Opitutus terrae]ACB73786.1 Redoxin domain protein [Opitutus terrae PB90-1]
MNLSRLAFPVLLVAAAVLTHAQAAPVPPTPAPDWKLKDLMGAEVSSEQFKGKVVVVDFWATWCGPCRMEIPGYVALQKKYGRDKLAIIGMSVDRGPDVVKKFVAANKVDYQIVMANDDVVQAFGGDEGINAIPTTFIIDRTGQIRDRKLGAEPTEEFEKRLATYLK